MSFRCRAIGSHHIELLILLVVIPGRPLVIQGRGRSALLVNLQGVAFIDRLDGMLPRSDPDKLQPLDPLKGGRRTIAADKNRAGDFAADGGGEVGFGVESKAVAFVIFTWRKMERIAGLQNRQAFFDTLKSLRGAPSVIAVLSAIADIPILCQENSSQKEPQGQYSKQIRRHFQFLGSCWIKSER